MTFYLGNVGQCYVGESGMKKNSFEFKMTKLDHLVLKANAANTRLATQRSHRLETNNNKRPASEMSPLEDDDLLLDNVPI
jgi:hypothetical protein